MGFLDNPIDIGSGVSIEYITVNGCETAAADAAHHCGCFVAHVHPDGEECVGSIQWCGKEPRWTLVQREPLTVAPSIQIKHGAAAHEMVECLHGYIREGRWVSC